MKTHNDSSKVKYHTKITHNFLSTLLPEQVKQSYRVYLKLCTKLTTIIFTPYNRLSLVVETKAQVESEHPHDQFSITQSMHVFHTGKKNKDKQTSYNIQTLHNFSTEANLIVQITKKWNQIP